MVSEDRRQKEGQGTRAEKDQPNEKRVRRAEQDRNIAELISAVEEIILGIRKDANVSSVLAGVGYDAGEMQRGIDLCRIAQEQYTWRQQALNEQKKNSEELRQSISRFNKKFSDYRVIARSLFPDRQVHAALGASGRRPRDLQKLLAVARAASQAATEERYIGDFTKVGLDVSWFDTFERSIDDLLLLDVKQNLAIRKAREATRTRNEAARDLQRWFSRMRAVASRALRDIPHAGDLLSL